jgi:hypothetical protein
MVPLMRFHNSNLVIRIKIQANKIFIITYYFSILLTITFFGPKYSLNPQSNKIITGRTRSDQPACQSRRRPDVVTHTLRNGTLTEHDIADTINLFLSIGDQTISAINSNMPVSPFPYNLADIDSRIKVLSQRITAHKSEISSG